MSWLVRRALRVLVVTSLVGGGGYGVATATVLRHAEPAVTSASAAGEGPPVVSHAMPLAPLIRCRATGAPPGRHGQGPRMGDAPGPKPASAGGRQAGQRP